MLRAKALDSIFRPRKLAVVGASRKPGSIGYSILDNLLSFGFQGAIYPVNPHAESVHSLKCYPSLRALPDPIDCAVVVVPAPLVEGVIEEGLAVGVGGFVVISAGFGETGEEGKRVEQRLREKVRAAERRMIGPNCMGVINTEPNVRMNATFAPVPPLAGSVGFVSQSGALGVAILNVASSLGIGLTQFASMGNKADVSGNDLLEFWEQDSATRIIAMYLESFGNPRKFAELAKRIGREKPILVVKSGRTEEGARAASSHTGALASGQDVTVSAFLDSCGVIRAETIQELFDVALALDRCPLPKAGRVGIVTNAGGPGIMATDAVVGLGLELARLGEATRTRLRALLPREASLENPVDMIASAGVPEYEGTLEAVLQDPQVDAVLAINVTPLLSDPRDILEAIGRVAASFDKPVFAVMMAEESFYEGLRGISHLPPVYRFPEPAARALRHLVRYAEWRRRALDPTPRFSLDFGAVRSRFVAAERQGEYLDPGSSFELLEAAQIPVARWRRVSDAASAGSAAKELGFPVVLKAVAPGLVHKTELGAVVLGLATVEEVERKAQELEARVVAAGLEPAGFLVQSQVPKGHETIFGASRDPRLGPVVLFGLGGQYVEVFRDFRLGVPPLGRNEARELVMGIRGRRLLEGVRGEKPVDQELLVEVLLRVAQLVESFPEVLELDINPFVAYPGGGGVAVDVRVRLGSESPAG